MKTRTLLMILTMNLITLFSGLRAYRALRRTTEPRIKVNRSDVRARASTTAMTPPSSPLGQLVTWTGSADSGSLCAHDMRLGATEWSPETKDYAAVQTYCQRCDASWRFVSIAVPAAAPTTSTYPSVASPLFAVPAQGGATYSSMPSNTTVPLPPRDEDVLP